jgi:hypothetical protein
MGRQLLGPVTARACDLAFQIQSDSMPLMISMPAAQATDSPHLSKIAESAPNAVSVGPKDRTLLRRHNTGPPFRWVKGFDDRVFCRVKMLCSVSIWRLIATIDMAAAAADPQMQPGVDQFQTFFAPQGARNNVTDCREMFAKYRDI